MHSQAPGHLKIESVYASVLSGYWVSLGAFSGFMAVYLGYYGFTDTQIGLTASAVSVVSIIFQLMISSFSDSNQHIPIKKIISLFYFIMMALVTVLALIPLPIALMLIIYSVAGGLFNGIPSLLNALIMQFVNAGIRLNFGWPRGVSALIYALFAFLLGLLLENYAPSVLMPICLIAIVCAVILLFLMPRPDQVDGDAAIPSLAQPLPRTTLRQLLSSSRVLQLFLLSCVFMSAGQSNTMLFLPRIVEANGGTSSSLGFAMFIQAGMEMPAMFLSPFLLSRFRARAILCFSLLAYVAKYTTLYFADSMTGVYLSLMISVFCFGLFAISSMYFVNDIVRHNEKVRAQTLIAVCGAFSAILGNLGAGLVIDRFGIDVLNLVCVFLQVIAALLMFLCAYMQLRGEKTPVIQPVSALMGTVFPFKKK